MEYRELGRENFLATTGAAKCLQSRVCKNLMHASLNCHYSWLIQHYYFLNCHTLYNVEVCGAHATDGVY